MSQKDEVHDHKEKLRRAALDYHEFPTPGKVAVHATKQMVNQHDLALAYSPGVAAACEEIVKTPEDSFRYTSRGNLVGVISNGTAVLGLGNIGALASKPVMEGKGVLFKKFAGIDVFDLEVNESDPDKLIDIIASLEPTFGGINLEDIKAPECFYIEEKLRERMKIPVFHDDQHGTAIVVAAAVLNGLKVVGKKIEDVKLVTSGAGAAALACVNLLIGMGLPVKNVWATDINGVVYKGRHDLNEMLEVLAQETTLRTLDEVIDGADIFLGLSAGGVLKPEMVKKMGPNPLVLALANPNPEILPEDAKAVRPDAILATGRTDYPNQVNNVLCFPYIFRGALDCGATTINTEMKIAAVKAIAELAQAEQDAVVAKAYLGTTFSFGPDYLIPKPFDSRLMLKIAPAVAQAAQASGVASRPIEDMRAYRERLQQFVYHSGSFMKPIFAAVRSAENKRIVYAEGEEERILRAVQIVVDERLARPILVGRPNVIESNIERYGLRLKEGQDYEVVNTESDERYADYWVTYHRMTERRGVTAATARMNMRKSLSLIGTMLVAKGEADGLICGTWDSFESHLTYVDQVIGRKPGCKVYAAMHALLLPGRQFFILDTHVNYNPSAQELAEMTVLASTELKRFGLLPKVALLSHSNFGNSNSESAVKMRETLALLNRLVPDLEVDGEMQGDMAFDEVLRAQTMPNTTLKGQATLLVMPNLDAANISYNLLKTGAGNGVTIGPILLGVNKPVSILSASSTVRRIVNMTAYTANRAITNAEKE